MCVSVSEKMSAATMSMKRPSNKTGGKFSLSSLCVGEAIFATEPHIVRVARDSIHVKMVT